MRPAPAAVTDGSTVSSGQPAEFDLVVRSAAPNAAAAGRPVDRALRLGAALLGCPLVFSEADSFADAGGGLPRMLPEGTFAAAAAIVDEDGERLGTLRALDLARLDPFGAGERETFADVAALIGADLSARRRLGDTDHVTGLPTRRRFEADFARVVSAPGGKRILMLVTLSEARHYSELLRVLGHSCAESFVRRGAETIGALSGADRLYHVSVLSFAFFLDDAVRDATALARDLVAAFAEPIVCDGLPLLTRIGVGLTRLDRLSSRPAEALRAALAAAQDSRRLEQGFSFYDRRSDEAHARAFGLLSDLGQAMRADDELSLVYQPRIDLATGEVAGAEALIRWVHPKLGQVSPVEFVPLTEATALIGPMTDWVLAAACRQSSAWAASGARPRLSVNISPASLRDSGFIERSERIIAAYGVDPADLEFEVTEGILTSSEAGVRARIDALRATGATIAIDDFGTGYSNLDCLTRLPADVLKIDRSFIQTLDADPRRRKLVRTMIDMAHDFGFRVVAEGVETASAYERLAAWGCDEAQGFHISRPLDPDAFEAFVSAR